MALVVLVAAGLVYETIGTTPALAQTAKGRAAPQSAAAAKSPLTGTANATLPAPVAEMREAILTAARTGRIEEMRTPIELNELRPEIAATAVPDPIAHWRQLSEDGAGREVLAEAINALELGHAIVPLGKDLENNRIFVWPYLAELPLGALTPEQEVDLYRLVSVADAKAMIAKGKYAGWRLAIGADGTWHSFRKGE